MPATTKDEFLPRSIMFLCLGSALLLAISQLHARTNQGLEHPPKSPATSADLAQGNPPPLPADSPEVVVNLGDRHVYLYKQKHLLAKYPLAVGKKDWQTPVGTFRILQMKQDPDWVHPITKKVVPPGPDNPLGDRWIGFWSDGRTQIGFHGTNQEELIGQAVSHGCLRMRNQDIEALYQQVAVGTLVTVRP